MTMTKVIGGSVKRIKSAILVSAFIKVVMRSSKRCKYFMNKSTEMVFQRG